MDIAFIMDNPTIERASKLFAALGNPSRLRITELLCREEMSVGEICSALSLRQSATSQNLAELVHAGILSVEHRGTHRIYKVRGPRIGAILSLIEEYCEVHSLYGIPDPLSAENDPAGTSKS
jgi:DNA-binding transcriptional ArsR family regulator